MMVELKGLDARETEQWAARHQLAPYRGRQIRQWVFKKLVHSFEQMTNLPKVLRADLEGGAVIDCLRTAEVLVSRDGTEKHLFKLSDGNYIETVLIPEKDHWTVCVSSQVGCAMGCRFCLTAKQGFIRNLTPGEIVDQVIQVKRSLTDGSRLTNIVFMGMGEPLDNYAAVVKALEILLDENGMNFSHRKVTLSTCGLVPGLKRLGRVMAINLAVSLNASDDETRSALMPVNRRYPLKDLLEACRQFPLPNRRMLTFEYILIGNVNDSAKDAFGLTRLLSGLKAKINLIPLNPHERLALSAPTPEDILRFQKILLKHHFTAIIRKSKGQDILAACGQLSSRYEVNHVNNGEA